MSQTPVTNEATEQAASDETVLSIQGVVKRFGSNIVLRGLDLDEDEASTFRANITPGSVEAPETWYSPFLDALFGVE